ncbi:MAG: hypothetical protein WC602_00460 [archaeon]
MPFNFYKGNYKAMLLLPAILFIVFGLLIAVYPGVPKGIDIKGGTLIIVKSPSMVDAAKLKQAIDAKYSLSDLTVTSVSSPASTGALIQYSENTGLSSARSLISRAQSEFDSNPGASRTDLDSALVILSDYQKGGSPKPTDLKALLVFAQDSENSARESFQAGLQEIISSELGIRRAESFQIKEVNPTIGEAFWNNALWVALASMIFLTVVIFALFREIIPSLAVLLAAAFDVMCALAFMAILKIPLSLNSIPSLLILVGYSIDTDVMLTGRLLKQKDATPREKAQESMWTGMTMTFTALAALGVMLLLSYFYQVTMIYEVGVVLFFGLLGDIPSTWMMNAPILLWYVERQLRKKELKAKGGTTQ